jgi:hypothetical protein
MKKLLVLLFTIIVFMLGGCGEQLEEPTTLQVDVPAAELVLESEAGVEAEPEAELEPVVDASISVSTAATTPGDTFDITVDLNTNVSGVSLLFLALGYDSTALEIVNITLADLLPITSLPPYGANPVQLNFGDFGDPTRVVTDTGTLATIHFRVLDSAPNGVMPVTLTVADAYKFGGFDLDDLFIDLNVITTSGEVTITGGIPPATPTGVTVIGPDIAHSAFETQFNATVTPAGSPQIVNWDVSGHQWASINQNGRLNLYSDGDIVPADTQLTITATVPGTNISDTITVTVTANGTD